MNKIVIDLDAFENVNMFHLWLKEICSFPEYYGCNLDALYDCLTENPNFEFIILPCTNFENYQSSLVDTILDAGCKVMFLLDEELS